MFDSFNKMFRKVPAGWCRLSLTGGIAVKTSNGYKTYDVATGQHSSSVPWQLSWASV